MGSEDLKLFYREMNPDTSVRRLAGNDMDGRVLIFGKGRHVFLPFGVESNNEPSLAVYRYLRHQNAALNRKIKTRNTFLEGAAELKSLVAAQTNRNWSNEELRAN